MLNRIRRFRERIAQKSSRPIEDLVFQELPDIAVDLIKKYFRLEVEGIENLPKTGPVLIAANHSGFAGLDALIVAHEVFQATNRYPRMMAHGFWFSNKIFAKVFSKFGFFEARFENGAKLLARKKHVIVFPEGEQGNFKPTAKRYHLQPFRKGLFRLALSQDCAVVPVLVIGAEESQITLGQIRLPEALNRLLVPLPLNLIPLPSRWKIVFLPPIHFPYSVSDAGDPQLLEDLAQQLREQMQTALTRLVASRKSIYW